MKLSKTTALVLCAFSGSLAFAAEPASNVALYGVLDTGVYAHHASNGKTIVEMASGITKGSRFGLEGQENLGNDTKSISGWNKVLKVITATQKTQTPLFIVTVTWV